MLRNFWQVSYCHQDSTSQNVMYVYIIWRACYNGVSYLIGLRWAQDSIFLLNSQILSGVFLQPCISKFCLLLAPRDGHQLPERTLLCSSTCFSTLPADDITHSGSFPMFNQFLQLWEDSPWWLNHLYIDGLPLSVLPSGQLEYLNCPGPTPGDSSH